MKVLIINDVAGRLDQLQAVLEDSAQHVIDAIFVLGNLVTTTARQEVATLEAVVGDLPWSLANALEDEIAADESTYAGVFAMLGALGVPIYCIPGPLDNLTAMDVARTAYRGSGPLFSVHATAAALDGDTVIAGLGGAIVPPEGEWTLLEYSAGEVVHAFEHTARAHSRIWNLPKRIMLFATPPVDEAVHMQEPQSLGGATVATMIERYRPQWVCAGVPGSHQQRMTLHDTRVVDPGAVQHGAYAVIDLEREVVELVEILATKRLTTPTMLLAITPGPSSQRTLMWTAQLVERMNAHLVVLHAWSPPDLLPCDPSYATLLADRLSTAESVLDWAISQLPQLTPERLLVEGPAASAIVHAAHVHHADLVVLGEGVSAEVAPYGSTEQQVQDQVYCPVVVVPQPVHVKPLTVARTSERAVLVEA